MSMYSCSVDNTRYTICHSLVDAMNAEQLSLLFVFVL
jgi:hypothetical protein